MYFILYIVEWTKNHFLLKRILNFKFNLKLRKLVFSYILIFHLKKIGGKKLWLTLCYITLYITLYI